MSLPPVERLFKAIQGHYSDAELREASDRYEAAARRREAKVADAFELRIQERWAARWTEDWTVWNHRDPSRADRPGRFWLLVELRGRTWAQRQLDRVPVGQDPLSALEAAHGRSTLSEEEWRELGDS